jgi:serine phosphatase RsbU (regulator of sigma subunit)
MNELLAKLPLHFAEHVFELRHAARIASAALGCDEADQVRFATALSELGREALAHGGGATAAISLERDGALVIDVGHFPRGALEGKAMTGIDAARKLVGDVVVTDRKSYPTVTVTLRLAGAPARSRVTASELRKALSIKAAPLEDLRLENKDLIATLEALKSKATELVVLNDELEETNRGVMAMYDTERIIALSLQHNLLPDASPVIGGIEVAVRYVASAEHAEVGGDFYEIFTLPDDKIAIAIGDVVGHSLEAAMVMAQLRTGARCYLVDGYGPAQTLARLNRLLLQFHPDWTATVCCAIYDRRTRRCEVANAGHPPPLLRTREGSVFLPPGGTLLGVDAPTALEHTVVLETNDVLLMFTDGLVERRDEAIDVGLARLVDAMREPAASLDELCDRVLRDAGPLSVQDDIAIVAIRPQG